MDSLNITYLLLGSNLGDRLEYLKLSIHEIAIKAGNILSESKIYETEPVGFESNNNFLNQVIKVETALSPQELLKTILEIEKNLGRVRSGNGYSSRTIDIDILYYNEETISEPGLEIPHPRIRERKFTLLPLADIAPDLIHPVAGKSQRELLTACTDSSKVSIYTNEA